MSRTPFRNPCNHENNPPRLFDILIEGGEAYLVFKKDGNKFESIRWNYLACLVETLIMSEN